jgi:hypothetical protein
LLHWVIVPNRAPHTDAREAWRFCQPSFLHLFFCSRHRVRPFAKGGPLAEFGGEFHAVNIACLDDATVNPSTSRARTRTGSASTPAASIRVRSRA